MRKMPTHLGALSDHLNTYFHDTSILFQFTLQELLRSHYELLILKDLMQKIRTQNSSNDLNDRHRKGLALLRSSLLKLGALPTSGVIWQLGGGALNKLKNFVDMLGRASGIDHYQMRYLQHHITEALWFCLQSVEIFETHKGDPTDRKFFLFPTRLELNIRKIEKHIRCAGYHLFCLLPQFREDENILFFILKKRALFEKILGPNRIFEIFSSLFIDGIPEMLFFVKTRYEARGFDHMIPTIEEKVLELKESLT